MKLKNSHSTNTSKLERSKNMIFLKWFISNSFYPLIIFLILFFHIRSGERRYKNGLASSSFFLFQPTSSSSRDQPHFAVFPWEEVGKGVVLHPGTRPAIQILHFCQLHHTLRHGTHSHPNGTSVSDQKPQEKYSAMHSECKLKGVYVRKGHLLHLKKPSPLVTSRVDFEFFCIEYCPRFPYFNCLLNNW